MTNIKDLQLYKENERYYLSALIAHEDATGIYEMFIPKIAFPVNSNISVCQTSEGYGVSRQTTCSLDFGLGELYAQPFDNEGHYFTLTCLETKVHKMTLTEIEEKLGYKIEIVKEK